MMIDIDKERIRQRFARSLDTYDAEAQVQGQIAVRLAQMIKEYSSEARRILEIGAGTGLLTREVLQTLSPDTYFINDLVPGSCEKVNTYFAQHPSVNWHFIPGDMENLPIPEQLELIVSGSALQWFQDLEHFFKRAAQALVPGGYFIFNTYGPVNFQEIRKLTGKGLPYQSLNAIKIIANRYFRVENAFDELFPLSKKNPASILKHVRATGVNSTSNEPWTKGRLATFSQEYSDLFRSNEGVTLTYHPIYFVLEKR